MKKVKKLFGEFYIIEDGGEAKAYDVFGEKVLFKGDVRKVEEELMMKVNGLDLKKRRLRWF